MIFAKKIVAFILTGSMILSVAVKAAELPNVAGLSAVTIPEQKEDSSYAEYFETFKGVISPDYREEIQVEPNSQAGDIPFRLIPGGESYSMSISVPENGRYHIGLRYMPYGGYDRLVAGIELDGNPPFSQAKEIEFYSAWQDAGAITQDERGNDVRPEQKECSTVREELLRDNSGSYNEAYLFYLAAGSHTLKLTVKKGELALVSGVLCGQQQTVTYEQYREQTGGKPNTERQNILIEAEQPTAKSDPSLFATYDRSGPGTTPSDPVKMKLNTIGQDKFKYQNQWLSYQFKVEAAGYYEISLRVRQNISGGLFSSRRIYIDGNVPFEDLNAVRFPYDDHWYVKTLGDSDPYLFYFTKGMHEIKLETVPGETAQLTRDINEVLYSLNSIYRQIFMVTGASPDPYRDYDLDKQIPTLMEQMTEVKNRLASSCQQFIALSGGKKGTGFTVMDSLLVQLSTFLTAPDTIQNRMSNFKDNISALGSWLMSIKSQPLELDKLEIYTPDQPSSMSGEVFTKNLWFQIKALIGSFFEDYSSFSNNIHPDITVWCMTGRDQVQIIKDMIDDSFTPKYGVKVNINLVQIGIVEATLAGKGPDIALYVGETDPVFLGSRGVLQDLRAFKDSETVLSRLGEQFLVPYTYQDKLFGLPLTYDFPMLFYRTDVFESLGIQPPTTWDEFYKVVAVIQNKLMDVGVPTSMFDTMLLQRGGTFYNDEQDTCLLDNTQAIDAFQQLTDLFQNYSLPLSYDFFNRFRTGEMPMGIASYTICNQFQYAAPELRGLWKMSPVPAMMVNGQPVHTIKGSSTAAIMFKKTVNKQDAFQFLNWFSSTEAQTRYGRQLEIFMGEAGRYNPANKEVIKLLNWSTDEQQILLEQWKHIREVPVIPSSYYVSRNFINAFRKVTYSGANARETMILYVRDINREIARKREELKGIV